MGSVDSRASHIAATLSATLGHLERQRREALAGLWRYVLMMALLALAAWAAVAGLAQSEGARLLALLIVPLLAFWLRPNALKTYRTSFKREVIGRVVKARGRGYGYDAERVMAVEKLRESHLVDRQVARYQSEGVVQGAVGKISFAFSEIRSWCRGTVRDENDRRESVFYPLFHGVLLVAQLPNRCGGVTVIRPRRVLGRWLKREKAAFERCFTVRGDDQIARDLLTPALQERVLAFATEHPKTPIRFSFVEDQFYLGIEARRALVEPSIFRSSDPAGVIERYLVVLDFVTAVLQELDGSPTAPRVLAR